MAARDGLTAREAAARLAAPALLLAALARRAGGWIEHEPRLDLKLRLAEQLADDARDAQRLHARAHALDAGHPRAPGPALAALLDRIDAATSPAEHLAAAHDARRAVAALLAGHAALADPLVEEPTLAVVLAAAATQDRHLLGAELDPDAPELAMTAGEPRSPAPVPVAEVPAREPFLERRFERPPLDDVADALAAFLHASLAAGERHARAHHDAGDLAAAERAATHFRHAAVADRMLADHGSRWGERAVGPPHDDPFALAEAIALQHPGTARELGHLLADRA